jgi:hypothetical protein
MQYIRITDLKPSYPDPITFLHFTIVRLSASRPPTKSKYMKPQFAMC